MTWALSWLCFMLFMWGLYWRRAAYELDRQLSRHTEQAWHNLKAKAEEQRL